MTMALGDVSVANDVEGVGGSDARDDGDREARLVHKEVKVSASPLFDQGHQCQLRRQARQDSTDMYTTSPVASVSRRGGWRSFGTL